MKYAKVVVESWGRGPPSVSRSTSPNAWKARVVSTITTNSRVGPSIGSVTDQNRRTPPAPSTAAASWYSAGIPCRPAVTRMNVNPRPPHTLDIATAVRAVPGSWSQPGSFTDGNSELNHSTLASTPTEGCSRNSHIRLATATDVATVDEKIARNTPTPDRCLCARTASPMPNASPSGTVSRANFAVTTSAFWNSVDRKMSAYWPNPCDRQLPPKLLHRCCPSHTARPSG